MQAQPPPLTPEDISAMQAAQYADFGQPQTVKIFGIMHILLAVYGVGAAALGAFATFAGNPVYKFLPKTPELSKQMAMEAEMQNKMMPFTIFALVMSVILAVMLLIAGIKLLKKRRSGLVWSNRYAWTSLAGKVVTLILTIIYTLPAMKEMATDPAMPAVAQSVMGPLMVASAVIGVVFTCIYPILTLVLLNLSKTKEWFAARPE